ncbi:metallophosphoesterase [Algiphilus sp.]
MSAEQGECSAQGHRHIVAVGDLHGCYETLCALLERIGCVQDASRYHPPESTLLVFLGDLIDRGPRSRETVATVRRMVEAGDALCIAGNHEFNAVLYHTRDPEQPGEFVRRRTEKNRKQIAATLASYEGHADQWADDLAWFHSLPMAIEIDGLRCVHACWDQDALSLLQRHSNAWYLPEQQWTEAGTEGSPLFDAIERICKGPEATMPDGGCYHDKDGNPRFKARVAWWQLEPATWADRFRLPKGVQGFDPEADCDASPESVRNYAPEEPPVVFGHYWLSGRPSPLSPNAACLDYSAVLGGKLVAYHHEAGMQAIHPERMLWVEARTS